MHRQAEASRLGDTYGGGGGGGGKETHREPIYLFGTLYENIHEEFHEESHGLKAKMLSMYDLHLTMVPGY